MPVPLAFYQRYVRPSQANEAAQTVPRSIAARQVNPPGNRFLRPIACQRDIAAGCTIHKDGLNTIEQGLDTDEWQGVRRVLFLIDA